MTQIFVESCVDFEVAHFSVLMVWRLPYPEVPTLIWCCCIQNECYIHGSLVPILAGLPGVVCQMDDILVFRKDQVEHDQHLEAVLRCIEEANGTLSQEKCEFSKTKLTFLGHIIDADGIRADPQKTEAIMTMSPPTSIPELRRFLGMANQLGKFTLNLAQLTQPLRELLSKSKAGLGDHLSPEHLIW